MYFTAAAQRPPHAIKFDFFSMHCVTASLFFSSFLRHIPSRATQIRLLEWKIRNDILTYVSRGCPTLLLDEISNYQPKQPSGWDKVIERVNGLENDGHGAKLVRALAHGGAVCRTFEGREGFVIEGACGESWGIWRLIVWRVEGRCGLGEVDLRRRGRMCR